MGTQGHLLPGVLSAPKRATALRPDPGAGGVRKGRRRGPPARGPALPPLPSPGPPAPPRPLSGLRGGGPAERAPRAPLKGPLMFANPGLSGGRGPGCWPNNRRLKGGRRGRCPGRPAPDPGGPGTTGRRTGRRCARAPGGEAPSRGGRGGPGRYAPSGGAAVPRPRAGRRGLLSQTGRAPPERDPGFQRRPWPGPSASLGI